jgi:hypothetical protein
MNDVNVRDFFYVVTIMKFFSLSFLCVCMIEWSLGLTCMRMKHVRVTCDVCFCFDAVFGYGFWGLNGFDMWYGDQSWFRV